MNATNDSETGSGQGTNGQARSENDLDLRSQLEVLREENRRLREEYRRAQRTTYYRSAFALGILGSLAVLGALLFPSVRTILLTIGAIGLFSGVLTYYLTPEAMITASVGEHIYESIAITGRQLVDELGLQDIRVYLPRPNHESPARLFVPQHQSYRIPEDPSALFITEEDERTHGVTIHPTGASLFEEFTESLTTPLASTPDQIASQLSEGVVKQTELVQSADPEVDTDNQRLRVAITGSQLGSIDRFDHPIVSFLGVGAAVGLETPVTVTIRRPESARSDAIVICDFSRD